MGNRQKELEVCVQLQGYDLTEIMRIFCNNSDDWSAVMDG